MKSKLFKKIFITSFISLAFICIFYVKGLPYIIQNQSVINFIQKTAKKTNNLDLTIKNPVLKTSNLSKIEFRVEKIYLEKEGLKLLDLDNFSTSISFKKIFNKKIILEKLVARGIYLDVNALETLSPKTEKKKEHKSNIKLEVIDALLGVGDCEILYLINPETKIHLKGKNIGVDNSRKIMKNVYFQLLFDITKKDKKITVKINDNQDVFFANKKFHVINCPISINNSNIFINFIADKKNNYDVTLYSNNLNVVDIIDFLNTQIIENNIQKDALSYLNDIEGRLSFNLNVKNNETKGKFKLINSKFKVRDVDNVPITLTKGEIDLTTDEIKLIGFEGFYDSDRKNKIDFEGNIKDYLKTIDTEITGNAIVRNDFLKKHLSKMAGTDLEIKGEAPTRITLKSKNAIVDLVWLFGLKPNQNIKVANDYLPFEDSYRLMKSEMHFENMILDIKSLDYHMVDKLPDRNKKEHNELKKPKPIFTIKSSMDIANNNFIKFVSFEIPEPLPSEILNTIIRQKIFEKGKISGKISYENKGNTPFLDGFLRMDRVLLPSYKTFFKEMKLEAKNNIISLSARGGHRRAKFSFNADILNKIKFPIIVKDINLSLENIDILNALEMFNNQELAENVMLTDEGTINVEASNNEFDVRNLIIEKGKFHLDKGNYKEIEFKNLDADLNLDKNGIVHIKSNKFEFAQGISSLSTDLDLVNKKYGVKLGILNVDSDVIANSLLGLKREIVGKSSGFINLTTDETMKLSGSIKFFAKSGTIGKMGLIQYVLKCASLLRNTVSMISPAIISDIINIPEGEFDKITGSLTLKNNVVTNIKIKTYSPQLSNYIAGRYNIDNGDTSLRIYTKFSNANKGLSGALRKISLSALANRIPMNSRNDLNYYAIELNELPEIEADDKDCQIFLTKVEGDVANNNYISSLKKLK